jgi:hypothetical protein
MERAGGMCLSSNEVKLKTIYSDLFHHNFTELYDYYTDTLTKVCDNTEDCEWPIESLPFSSFTLNVDKSCICDYHVDGDNCVCGLCLISPYGSFDYKAGGHLVLHELGLILELPPGSIAFIPSALITHHNIPIAPGETRQAFTAYTPARMFQWVENGYECFNRQPKVSKEIKLEMGRVAWIRGKRRLPHFYQQF